MKKDKVQNNELIPIEEVNFDRIKRQVQEGKRVELSTDHNYFVVHMSEYNVYYRFWSRLEDYTYRRTWSSVLNAIKREFKGTRVKITVDN